jgi:hypothetical protein
MINTGICPKCETTVRNVVIEDVDVHVGFTPSWKGISYLCPSCRAVLSVAIDPVALKSDIINGVVNRLKS